MMVGVPCSKKDGLMGDGWSPSVPADGFGLAVHCCGAYGQSGIVQVVPVQEAGRGTALDAAAKYKLKVLVPFGVPKVVALKFPVEMEIPH